MGLRPARFVRWVPRVRVAAWLLKTFFRTGPTDVVVRTRTSLVRLNRGYSYSEQLGVQARGRTVLEYLCQKYGHSTAAEWQERVQRGEVLLDGRVAPADLPLAAGGVLIWNRPPWEEPDADRAYQMVHEDDSLLVLIKPSGLPTLPSGGFLENTLLSVVREDFPEASPLHRLGRGTSGLVVFARTHAAAAQLSKAWRDREVHKRYRALACGEAREEQYEITAPIGLVPHPRLGSVFGANERGKPARSTGQVLSRAEGRTLFQVDIHTGRPDQIRIHLAFIGHPLLGDALYAAGGVPRAEEPGLPGDVGYFLHAEQLRFGHPVTGAALHFHAPAPALLQGAAVSLSPKA